MHADTQTATLTAIFTRPHFWFKVKNTNTKKQTKPLNRKAQCTTQRDSQEVQMNADTTNVVSNDLYAK